MNKQTTLAIFALLLTATTSEMYAQTITVSDTLQANSIRARVQSNGAFFLGGTGGEFLVPATTGGLPEISMMKSAGLWLGGRDSAGNLHVSAQLYNENGKTDFYPGVLLDNGIPYPEFNLIADVTSAQVNAHIVNPASQIPAIYSWPGRGNPYFFNYYGFDLPFSSYDYLAGFYDEFENGAYEPNFGDYPALALRGCPLKYNADEQLWFAFHDVGPHTQSGGTPLGMEVQTQFFGIECPEGSPVDRVVYVIYKLINKSLIPLDSCYFGVFMDFEVGNGGDDFIGCEPARRVVFAYNGDEVDEGGFENTPPVIAVDLLRGPLNDLGEEVDEWHFVPVDDANLNSTEEYYNLLAGRRLNGTPFPNNGLMYTGDPLNPSAWSEISDGNTPGERKALASFGPFTLVPGAINELVLGYAWVRKDPNGGVADNLSIVGATMDAVEGLYNNCFELFDGCPGNVSTNSPASGLKMTISPNPFAGWVRVESEEVPIQSVFLYDATGRLVREITAVENTAVSIQTGGLPAGLYGLQVRTKDGRSAAYKLIHE